MIDRSVTRTACHSGIRTSVTDRVASQTHDGHERSSLIPPNSTDAGPTRAGIQHTVIHSSIATQAVTGRSAASQALGGTCSTDGGGVVVVAGVAWARGGAGVVGAEVGTITGEAG